MTNPTKDPNTGHGHVYPRPDGVKARCGGPGLCAECARDLARKNGEQAPVPSNERSPKQMREDATLWAQAGYPRVAISRYRDAADEIERLTRERDAFRALLAEKDRPWCDTPLPGRPYPDYACGKCWTCRKRAALSGKPPSPVETSAHIVNNEEYAVHLTVNGDAVLLKPDEAWRSSQETPVRRHSRDCDCIDCQRSKKHPQVKPHHQACGCFECVPLGQPLWPSEKASAETTATSEWRGQDLWWCINGEWISDQNLRSWCYNNMGDSPSRYADCIRRCHIEAYARRSVQNGSARRAEGER